MSEPHNSTSTSSSAAEIVTAPALSLSIGASTTSTAASLTASITPSSGVPSLPKNSTLIQLAFNYELPYNFVQSSAITQQQIFDYLPLGVANGLNISISKVVMQYLQPYNTLDDLRYITTLAMAYIPE